MFYRFQLKIRGIFEAELENQPIKFSDRIFRGLAWIVKSGTGLSRSHILLLPSQIRWWHDQYAHL